MNSHEYIAYAGYFGAWTDNPSYWTRKRLQNSLVMRDALQLKSVSWFGVGTHIDSIPVTKEAKYDVFLYHGAPNGDCGVGSDLDVNISISLKSD